MTESVDEKCESDLGADLELYQAKIRSESMLAKEHIRADHWPLDQNLQEIICDEHDRQREAVEKFGHCETPCGRTNWVIDIRGETVCKWTRQPCIRFQLAPIVELYSHVNQIQPEETQCLP